MHEAVTHALTLTQIIIIIMIITEENDFIYLGAKLVSDKISIPRRNPNTNANSGWEMSLDVHIKKLRQQGTLLRKIRHTGVQQKEKTIKRLLPTFLTVQLEEINKKK